MAKFDLPEESISVDQLRPGVFVKLDSLWFSHPFLFNKFKIKNEEQIQTLKELGLEQVTYIPAKSDKLPKAESKVVKKNDNNKVDQTADTSAEQSNLANKYWEIKNKRIRQLKEIRTRINHCEQKYQETIKKLPHLMNQVFSGSKEGIQNAENIVIEMVSNFEGEKETIMHLVDAGEYEESLAYHFLNVSVLALMLGNEAGLGEQDMQCLGMGALLHDVGKLKIEKKVLRKPGNLSRPELELIQLHPRYGLELASKIGQVPEKSLKVIWQHHERFCGNGYPKGLVGKEIERLARITMIANIYDNLCNNLDPDNSVTPNQALTLMHTQYGQVMDMTLFNIFVQTLGIYPPGSLVLLSNQEIGMVITNNPSAPLKPLVLLYDPEIPKKEAIIINLAEDTDLAILRSFHPNELSKEVYNYLTPRKRVAYFMEQNQEKG